MLRLVRKEGAMKKKRRAFIIILIIIVIVLVGSGGKIYLESNLKNVANAEITQMDLSKTKDGIYSGSYNVFPIMVEVKVTINNHAITKIELVKHVNGQGKPAEVITEKVIETQSLQVDVVSGATYSSKVILKAIENALAKDNE
jgi:uncharacterized protein with FMN-binding domain